MTLDPAAAWQGLLGPDERIVWQGRPVARFAFRPSDIAISAFGLVFFAFAVFWTGMASSMTHDTGPFGYIFPLFGLPFIAVGGFMLFGRFFWDIYRRGRTWYTLTTRRAFIATNIFGHKTLKDYAIGADAEIVLIEEGREQTVTFAEFWQQSTKGRRHRKSVGFELLPDGRDVYAYLQAIRNEARDIKADHSI